MNESSLLTALGDKLVEAFAHIKMLESVDSTSSELSRMLKAGAAGLNLVVARTQSAGRGRHGKQWHSPANGNLYLSLGMPIENSTKELQALSLLTAIAVARACQQQLDLLVQLKWPNDVLVDGKKLGGVLLERIPMVDKSYLIFGIGLNVRLSDSDKEMIQRPAVGLTALELEPIDESALAASIVSNLLTIIEEFKAEGFQSFQEEWNSLDRHFGSDIVIQHDEHQLIGQSQGVNEYGRLQLLTANGLQEISSGEVFPSLIAGKG